ncbi:MAG: DNA mismatch repair endonuclease MutL [Erysipelotrichaceae bacterium]|nr:DNA mismatch repair endonuclease MutL [Erysipelotrichaceae bacterium]
MAKIKLLNEQLTNMIAAGEVVERPSGIVKELIENSLDAGSKNILVKVVDGGIKYIQVVDDGEGMDKEDAVMAFERHATSKIFKPNDLWEIDSFGFRGEALPSIASVSHVVMLTNNKNEGSKVEINYGEKVYVGPYGCNEGCDITITELFYKTPARLKHLKSPAYENSLINDIVVKFALSNPNVSFTFISDEKEAFKSSGNGDLLEIIFKLYGRDIVKSAIKIDEEDFDYKLSGYMIQPQHTRANRNAISIFMNSRMVRPYKIQKAIIDSYSDYIPNDRFPIVVLNIEMDRKLIDVNVHPSKWEVRLSKQAQLEMLIRERFARLLSKDIKPFTIDIVNKPKEKVETISFINELVNNQSDNNEIVKETLIKEEIKEFKKDDFYNEEYTSVVEEKNFPQMRVIGQFHGKFILAEGYEGLYVIDQHAAQERVHFEEISDKLSKNVGYFELLLPIMINTTSDVVSRINELNDFSSNFNIEFEIFGNDSLIVHKLPLWLQNIEHKSFLNDLIDYFKEDKKINKLDVLRHKIATMACHHSIRFNRILSKEEMQQVVDELKICRQPFQCPHGRPTFVLIEDYYLEREFLR